MPEEQKMEQKSPDLATEAQLSVIQRLIQADPDWHESLTEEQKAEVMWDWTLWARPKQLSPGGTWRIWLILAGRGFGKTRSGAEWVREQVMSGNAGRNRSGRSGHYGRRGIRVNADIPTGNAASLRSVKPKDYLP